MASLPFNMLPQHVVIDIPLVHAEPMTGPQTRYLGVMSNRNRIQIPFIARTDSNGQRVTKAEASTLLTKFEKGERVDASFIDELGRGEPVSNIHESPPLPRGRRPFF